MAKIKLDSTDRIRIYGNFREETFIDICGHKDELGMSLDLYPTMSYIEIRKKGGVCKMFMFEKKSHKKFFDFGFWSDAEVIFSLNEVLDSNKNKQ